MNYCNKLPMQGKFDNFNYIIYYMKQIFNNVKVTLSSIINKNMFPLHKTSNKLKLLCCKLLISIFFHVSVRGHVRASTNDRNLSLATRGSSEKTFEAHVLFFWGTFVETDWSQTSLLSISCSIEDRCCRICWLNWFLFTKQK